MSTARRAILIFLPLALVGALVFYLLYRAQADAVLSALRDNQEQAVAVSQQALTVDLAAVVSDLRYLSEQVVLQRWLATGDPAVRSRLAAEYLAFARSKRTYDQVRFIDRDGQEIVRVNWNRGGPFVVPEARLQNTSDRYYVADTLKLGAGEIYVSPFDLNAENGVIEQPFKPMIRFAAPVRDSTGTVRGMVIVNFLGQRLLDRLRRLSGVQAENLWLINGNGYWLLGPKPGDEWAFMFPNLQDRVLAQTFPNAWEIIEGGRRTGQFTTIGGLFTVAPLYLDEAATRRSIRPAEEWILVAHTSMTALSALSAARIRNYTITGAALLALLAVASWLVARHWSARRATERAVQESEQRFRSLIESAPDAVVVTDADGRIRLANAEAERLFGYARDTLVDQPIEILVPERFHGRHVAHRTSYVADPRSRTMGAGTNLDLRGRRRNGSEFPVAISLSPIRTAEGTMIFCDVRDTTEQVAAERQIRELNERLAHDNTALGIVNKELEAFSYSVSHDLRAPLRAIDGFSQALQEDFAAVLDETGRGYLQRVRQAAQRMGMLIDDLLKLARVSRAELSVTEIDLSAMARDILAALAEAVPDHPVDAEVEPGMTAQADARLLRVALENLLGNAWKFTAGRSPARIAFGRDEDGNNGMAYFVRDNGAGFDMAYAGKLFGAFQRLHDAGEFPGTGIGLATVQRIIHKHGGKIWAEAAPGRGATFRFTL